MESASAGILAGLNMALKLEGKETLKLPENTMMGALSHYISDETVTNFQPMGANIGILPQLEEKIRDKKLKAEKHAERSLAALAEFIKEKEI